MVVGWESSILIWKTKVMWPLARRAAAAAPRVFSPRQVIILLTLSTLPVGLLSRECLMEFGEGVVRKILMRNEPGPWSVRRFHNGGILQAFHDDVGLASIDELAAILLQLFSFLFLVVEYLELKNVYERKRRRRKI